jgi:predicted HTH domain antitoxin
MSIEIQDLIHSGVYPNSDTAIHEALRVLWQERPSVRIEVAAHRYRTEDISLAQAAAVAGVSFDRMKEILAERSVPLRLGPSNLDEARVELDVLQRMRG